MVCLQDSVDTIVVGFLNSLVHCKHALMSTVDSGLAFTVGGTVYVS